MNRLRERKTLTLKNSKFAIAAALFLLVGLAVLLWFAWPSSGESATLRYVSTVAGLKGEFGEPFGIAMKGSDIYVSDGQNGKIWVIRSGAVSVFAEGLDTPSGIAFDRNAPRMRPRC